MENFFGVLIVLVVVLAFIWPAIRRFLAPALSRWMMRRMEDQMRRMAGMPSRKEEKKRRRKAAHQTPRQEKPGPRAASGGREPIIPKDYPEDVEFVEIKSYSEETSISGSVTDSSGKRVDYEIESQIEDVEFTEIKTK